MSEDKVQQLHDHARSELPERTRAAMVLMDWIADGGRELPPERYDELRRTFSEAELVDLGMFGAFFFGWQRFIETFGIRPDFLADGEPRPWLPRSAP